MRQPNFIAKREIYDKILQKLSKKQIVRITKGVNEGYCGEVIKYGDTKVTIKTEEGRLIVISLDWIEIL